MKFKERSHNGSAGFATGNCGVLLLGVAVTCIVLLQKKQTVEGGHHNE